MMASMPNTDAGAAQYSFDEAYAFDRMLIDLKQQLTANTRQYSRASNMQQRNSAMRIAKPGSANNSPSSSGLQAARKATGYGIRPARPISWHPSSHRQAQQPFLFHQDSHATYHDEMMLASPHYQPPTPAVYSGYASPTESYSPRSPQLYFAHNSQKSMPAQHQQQPQALDYRPMPAMANYNTPSMEGYRLPDQCASHRPALGQHHNYFAVPTQQLTAPSSPTYFNGNDGSGGLFSPPGIIPSSPTAYSTDYQHSGPISTPDIPMQQRHDGLSTHPTFSSPTGGVPTLRYSASQLPRIYDDSTDDHHLQVEDRNAVGADEGDGDGEILYGLGLYDKPGSAHYHRQCRTTAAGGVKMVMARPAHGASRVPPGGAGVVRRRFGWEKGAAGSVGEGGDGAESGSEDGKAGLGMKLEEAWTPPASEDEEDGEEDGEGDADFFEEK
ncbi:hypothetical protein BT67DRAFT_484107 [Trichocladium antarcticum]|uniref:Uncharacterized protein n=1 Tax=Trichocladium antarcticum TaxID=1450529 RepID=A0AAN6ZHN8_9PEZI|nr:hypothetical protein BT67DRAFT_484107 [Trichocladium antarcticum]